jgi:hypothetical protein
MRRTGGSVARMKSGQRMGRKKGSRVSTEYEEDEKWSEYEG